MTRHVDAVVKQAAGPWTRREEDSSVPLVSYWFSTESRAEAAWNKITDHGYEAAFAGERLMVYLTEEE